MHTRLTLTLVAHHIQSLLVSQHIQTLTQTLLLFPLTFLLSVSLSHTHTHTHIKDYFWPREETLNSGYDPDSPLSLWTSKQGLPTTTSLCSPCPLHAPPDLLCAPPDPLCVPSHTQPAPQGPPSPAKPKVNQGQSAEVKNVF